MSDIITQWYKKLSEEQRHTVTNTLIGTEERTSDNKDIEIIPTISIDELLLRGWEKDRGALLERVSSIWAAIVRLPGQLRRRAPCAASRAGCDRQDAGSARLRSGPNARSPRRTPSTR